MTNNQNWSWGNRIRGGDIRKQVRERLLNEYDDELIAKRIKIEILRFAAPEYEEPLSEEQQRELASYQAAEDSRQVKTSSFRQLHIEVPEREFLPQNMTRDEFQSLIDELNADPSVNGLSFNIQFQEIFGKSSPPLLQKKTWMHSELIPRFSPFLPLLKESLESLSHSQIALMQQHFPQKLVLMLRQKRLCG